MSMTSFVVTNVSGLSCTLQEYYVRHQPTHLFLNAHADSLPAAYLLAVFQFVPVIRYKFLILHRINGYITITLLLLGSAGALMIVRQAFGGTLATQTAVGLAVIVTILSLTMAYYNIKRLQIEQHRAWMLRTFFYVSLISTAYHDLDLGTLLPNQANPSCDSRQPPSLLSASLCLRW